MDEKLKRLYEEWKNEEEIAHIQGWDFSHIANRYGEEDELPWDFKSLIKRYLTDEMNLLDMETGGGEFLLELNHPYQHTAAIEGYGPNIDFCTEKLVPLGIDFKAADGADILPFGNSVFDVVVNRHGDYSCSELRRVLRNRGLFFTQQVGAENDWELIKLLQPEIDKVAFPDQYLDIRKRELEEAGFDILHCGETFQPIRFFDVGALVWFAKIIEWEFVNFEVDKYLDNLYRAQEILEKNGVIEGRIHRFYIVAQNCGV